MTAVITTWFKDKKKSPGKESLPGAWGRLGISA
jgi:hypothetical protein